MSVNIEREPMNPLVAESLLDYGPICVFCQKPIRRDRSWCFFASMISMAFMCHECEDGSEKYEPKEKPCPS